MKSTSKIKIDSFNASICYPLEYSEAMQEAKKEAKSISKDFDAVIILMKLLTGKNSKTILKLKNNYAKQLKKDIEQLLK